MNIIIRQETSSDHTAVYDINKRAFGQPNEANLVEALRKKAKPFISLVAVFKNQIVGHIFFSEVTIESEYGVSAMGLAPMAVLPEYQRQGIGEKLVKAGLKECQRFGYQAVFVLGHPQYYPRFGFIPAGQKDFFCEYDVPDEVFMVLELKEGALKGKGGLVKYHPEFAKF